MEGHDYVLHGARGGGVVTAHLLRLLDRNRGGLPVFPGHLGANFPQLEIRADRFVFV